MKNKLSCFLLCLGLLTYSYATENNVNVTNITGRQFTVSWITSYPCIGKLCLLDKSGTIKEYFDDNKNNLHYVTVDGLIENTTYKFSIVSGDVINDNNGQMYHVSTGPDLIPVGSIQPAGKVLLDNNTPAEGAIVYIDIYNSDALSASMSTVVDRNGYWYIELVNSRTDDNQHLFNPSETDILKVTVIGNSGTAYFEDKIMDNNCGKNLYPPLILQ
jgi:hypothetical protein